MQLPCPSDLEMVSAEIDPSLLLCLIYRPPNSTEQLNSSLITYLNLIDRNKNSIIMGDLNFPNIYSGSSLAADVFAEVTVVHGINLTQIITGPTHCTGNTLNIVLSNINGLQHTDTCTNFPPNLSSDHYLLQLYINHVFIKPTKTDVQRLDYSRANCEYEPIP